MKKSNGVRVHHREEKEQWVRVHLGNVWCTRQLEALVLRLLVDKDHTKVYEAVAKVEKAMGTGRPWSGLSHRGRATLW